ncbi:MAG: methyltransferase domain-containing protein [Luteimonas sp.]
MSLEQWETYHRGGALATCPTALDGGYDLEVRASWIEFFSTLPDTARILDVGTGNGVVALIASDTAKALDRKWEIHGADLAMIDPVQHVPDGQRRLAGIVFHPCVAMERLPFAAETFDAVSGHYALEYADPASALAQIYRVLKPSSDAQFIVHHADSVLVRSARLSLQEAELVFTETKIFRRLHRLVTMDQVTQEMAQETAAELRTAIRRLKHELHEARQAGTGRMLSVTLDSVQKLLTARKQARPHVVGLDVERAEADMRASVRRLNDLIDHARTQQDMNDLQAMASATGFSLIERVPQYHAGKHLVGWQLLLHRG